ncbi:polymorphic toxin-type HINT domain-containing protein [Micromonospora sp. M12]
MGDGFTKAIEDIALGDMVLASDPETGKTEAREVVGLIVGQGYKDLVEVTVDTDGAKGDASGSVIATDGHPFWVADLKEWVKAADLKPGQWLRTSAGTLVQVEAVRPFAQQRRVHNLTVDGIHTYHVLADLTPILVHNCGDGAEDRLSEIADSIKESTPRDSAQALSVKVLVSVRPGFWSPSTPPPVLRAPCRAD